MKLPRNIGPVHFVGIGGIGMSGIAEVLCNLGYTVQGSDASESANVNRLRDKGITINVGHKAENVAGAGIVFPAIFANIASFTVPVGSARLLASATLTASVVNRRCGPHRHGAMSLMP